MVYTQGGPALPIDTHIIDMSLYTHPPPHLQANGARDQRLVGPGQVQAGEARAFPLDALQLLLGILVGAAVLVLLLVYFVL